MPRKVDIPLVREGMHWYLIGRYYGQFDLFLIVPMLCAANQLGIQVIRTLSHYGGPE